MSTNLAAVATPPEAASIPADEPLSFEQRWAAWQARGAAHDRAVRRKMTIAAPILILVAAAVAYALLGR